MVEKDAVAHMTTTTPTATACFNNKIPMHLVVPMQELIGLRQWAVPVCSSIVLWNKASRVGQAASCALPGWQRLTWPSLGRACIAPWLRRLLPLCLSALRSRPFGALTSPPPPLALPRPALALVRLGTACLPWRATDTCSSSITLDSAAMWATGCLRRGTTTLTTTLTTTSCFRGHRKA